MTKTLCIKGAFHQVPSSSALVEDGHESNLPQHVKWILHHLIRASWFEGNDYVMGRKVF